RTRLMAQDAGPIGGEKPVEIDETSVGGRRRFTPKGRPSDRSHKTPVFGMVERKGRVVALAVRSVQSATLLDAFQERILPASVVYTTNSGNTIRLATCPVVTRITGSSTPSASTSVGTSIPTPSRSSGRW